MTSVEKEPTRQQLYARQLEAEAELAGVKDDLANMIGLKRRAEAACSALREELEISVCANANLGRELRDLRVQLARSRDRIAALEWEKEHPNG